MGLIKKYLLKKYIAENKKVRDTQVVALRKAKRIGILCNITTEDTYKDIYAIFSKLQTTTRSVWLMGYINDKAVPFYCLQQLSADYFCDKDLNWFGRPEKGQIKDFFNTEFDVLIDFTHDAFEPLRLIMAVSSAKLIVGSEKRNAEFYDLLIQTEEPLSNMELLRNIDKYTLKLSGE